ncbi:Hypothetical protein Minf_0884 [Methylacidiphilum infernorum V4]|uniref:Uncharacterized protein n=1 Tax=Methylacidiphilum infernorum (isolate V4) TaxID=481448 RepID=B3DUD6_METI4|nr:Hypothetical protein Minf_0884 [Methylacidiphilum infernorum V4]
MLPVQIAYLAHCTRWKCCVIFFGFGKHSEKPGTEGKAKTVQLLGLHQLNSLFFYLFGKSEHSLKSFLFGQAKASPSLHQANDHLEPSACSSSKSIYPDIQEPKWGTFG